MAKDDPVRFGAEFGPKRTGTSTGVSLSTFKTLVWVSNLGGLLLVVIGLELMIVQSEFFMALGCIIAGVIVAMFPSNYEIVGMEGIEVESGNDNQE
ncbi:MAG: hypothetical protein VW970_03065 [Candidatus Poseidoniales archaeon]|jgi:hypothetical protein|nr:hypothetical protein [Euryarchaeota archaeon]|tara:strand:- start:515 stop:802 length:288 start_codon:yes stop_codon:yes gene_type:complete